MKAQTRVTADKQAIGRDYRAGILSNREVGIQHGVSEGYVRKVAKKEGWTRDLNAQVQAKADALVRIEEVRGGTHATAVFHGTTDQDTVNASAAALANVKLGLKRTISRLGALAESLLAELEMQSVSPTLLAEFAAMLRSPNEFGADRLNDLMQKIVSLPGRTEVITKLGQTLKLYTSMTREAWNMDDKGAEDKIVNPLASLLLSMRQSALPVVYEVERDENL